MRSRAARRWSHTRRNSRSTTSRFLRRRLRSSLTVFRQFARNAIARNELSRGDGAGAVTAREQSVIHQVADSNGGPRLPSANDQMIGGLLLDTLRPCHSYLTL